MEASPETIIGTKLTHQETTETRALSLVEDQGREPGLELSPFGGKTERMMSGCSSQTTKDGLLGNRVTSIDWRCVGNVDQKRELCRGLLGITSKECRSSIEPKTAKVRLDIGDRGEFLDDGGSDLLGTVTSRIKGETPKSVQSIP